MSDKPLSIRHQRFVRDFLNSRLLTPPHIAAAIAVGRQRPAQAPVVAVEGRICIDMERAGQARRAGVIALELRDHRKQEQRLRLKPGRPEPRLTAGNRVRYEERCAACERALDHRKQEQGGSSSNPTRHVLRRQMRTRRSTPPVSPQGRARRSSAHGKS